jgi:hypothetical protein
MSEKDKLSVEKVVVSSVVTRSKSKSIASANRPVIEIDERSIDSNVARLIKGEVPKDRAKPVKKLQTSKESSVLNLELFGLNEPDSDVGLDSADEVQVELASEHGTINKELKNDKERRKLNKSAATNKSNKSNGSRASDSVASSRASAKLEILKIQRQIESDRQAAERMQEKFQLQAKKLEIEASKIKCRSEEKREEKRTLVAQAEAQNQRLEIESKD